MLENTQNEHDQVFDSQSCKEAFTGVDEWLLRVGNEVLDLAILLSEIYVSIVEKQPSEKELAIT